MRFEYPLSADGDVGPCGDARRVARADPALQGQPDMTDAASLPTLLPLAWESMAAELVAATLNELAEEFDHEAREDGDNSAGLAVAALVLQDRAVEALTGLGTHPRPHRAAAHRRRLPSTTPDPTRRRPQQLASMQGQVVAAEK